MSEAMDALGFKHRIGDIVAVRGSCTTTTQERLSFRQDQPTRYVVLERHAQQCPGGVQLHYKCRGVTPDGHIVVAPLMFLEIELEPSDPFAREGESRVVTK